MLDTFTLVIVVGLLLQCAVFAVLVVFDNSQRS